MPEPINTEKARSRLIQRWGRNLGCIRAAPQLPGLAEALRSWLAGLVEAAATRYLSYGHSEPVMLVHSATAPNAILGTPPTLDGACGRPAWASWARPQR